MPPPPGALNAAPAAPAAPPPAAGGPNIGAIVKRMLSHLPVAVVVMALGIAITVVMSRSRKPVWGSETVIFYRQGISAQFVGVEGAGEENLKALPGRLKGILMSRAPLEKIIKEFNLYQQIVETEGMVDAVDKFRTKITFKPRSAEEFLIAFEGATPEEAQQVTARLADILIEDVTEKKKARAKTATEFLENEKKRAEEDLEKRETELVGFLARHPEFAAENNADQAGAGIRAEKARAIADPELLALDGQQARIRAALAAKNAPAGPAIPGAPAGPGAAAQALLAAKQAADNELAVAQKDLNDKSEKLTDQHPDVRQAKSRFVAAQVKAREAMAAVIAATPNPAPAAAAGGDDPYETKPVDDAGRLERELQKTEREIQMRKRGIKPDANASAFAAQIIELEKQWKTLNREREKAKSRLANIDERLFKAKQNEESELSGYNATVLVMEPAYLPTQTGTMPKKKFIIIGVVVSLLVGLVAAAAWGMLLDDRVFVPDDLAALAPVLVSVPAGPAEKPNKGDPRA
jgi:hypothetical protein